jgi:taurine dioxygenase
MEVRPLTDVLGAEVLRWSTAQTRSPQMAARLRSLLDQYHLLLFRGTVLDVETQLVLMSAFGPPCAEGTDDRPWSIISNIDPDTPRVFRRSSDTDGFQSRLLFHQDYVWSPWPHSHLSLYAADLTGDIAATVFASNHVGYRALSDVQRNRFANLHVMHAFELRKDSQGDEARRNRITDLAVIDRFGRTVQPMIKPHPRTSIPLLYVNELFSSHIVECGLTGEGEALLQEAYAALYADEVVYRHQWRLHDLLIWDNIALQHARGPVRSDARRTLRRVAVNEKTLAEVFADARD